MTNKILARSSLKPDINLTISKLGLQTYLEVKLNKAFAELQKNIFVIHAQSQRSENKNVVLPWKNYIESVTICLLDFLR